MLAAQTIRNRVKESLNPTRVSDRFALVIDPFCERTIHEGRTYGLASCSYDVRLAQDLWVWPFWGRLGSIMEYISMPIDLSAEVKDKSSNARLFVLVQNTLIDPGWYGYLTVEITRLKLWPVRLKKGTPIAQIVFHGLDEPTERPYAGKYSGQRNAPQPAIFERSK
jgi:dCTP deaminase